MTDARARVLTAPRQFEIRSLPVPDPAKEAGTAVGIPEMMGDLAVFQILLRNPPVAAALNGMLTTLLWNGTLDARLCASW